MCWQWWMGARRRRSFVRFSGFHRSEALFLKVWFAGSSMPIRMVWFLKMRWASLKKPWSLSAFELVGRYIHIHIVGHQVLIISDENFRWSALCPICFTWCQKMHLTLLTPQKRFDLTNDVGVILKILYHTQGTCAIYPKYPCFFTYLIYPWYLCPQTCKIVSAFGWALHGDGLGLWRSDHRRRAHNCFL